MTKRIILEDHGQDFLWWDVDCDGNVLGCGPSQSWVWEGVKVLNHADIKVGDVLHIRTQGYVTTTLNYRCCAIESGA